MQQRPPQEQNQITTPQNKAAPEDRVKAKKRENLIQLTVKSLNLQILAATF